MATTDVTDTDTDADADAGTDAATTPRSRLPPRVKLWLGVVAALLGIALLCSLGSWQLRRLAWKDGIVAQIAARLHAEPQPLAALEARFARDGDVEYWPVRLTGRFLHAGERTFQATWQGQSGWNVYTPLVLPDSRMIFVNRGFVPYVMKDPATRAAGQPAGEVEITGLARNPLRAKPSSFIPDNDPAENVYFWKDLPAMAAGLPLPPGSGVLPFLVDAGAGPPAPGAPVGGVTVVDVPNNHLQYALTWYGLALALAVMLGASLVKSWRSRPRRAVRREGPAAKG